MEVGSGKLEIGNSPTTRKASSDEEDRKWEVGGIRWKGRSAKYYLVP